MAAPTPAQTPASTTLNRKPICEIEIELLADLKGDLKRDNPDFDGKSRKKLVALEALTEWTEQVAVVERKLSRRTKRVDSLTNEIYQLVGLYSVFVGLVFTAVQADRVRCQHVWSPTVLCLLPCFIIARVVERKLKDIHLTRKDSPEGSAKLQADPPTSTCFIL